MFQSTTQLTFSCSKSIMETLEKDKKYVQSLYIVHFQQVKVRSYYSRVREKRRERTGRV